MVAVRWWLVAGLRILGAWLFEPRLTNMLSLLLLIRFTSLLGGIVGVVEVVGERIGAPDPCEKENEESGPRLDLGLSCCDAGLKDSRLIQEL